MLALFAVALAGTGLLTTVGVIVAMDTFGPVSDNAQGIAEMSGDVQGAGAQVLTDLDAVGNTTKAITKGIAIATAVLAATALFGSFTDAIDTDEGQRRSGGPRAEPQPGHLPAEQPGRAAARRGRRLPLLRARDQRGVAVGGRGGLRGAPAVPRAPRDHGLHRDARSTGGSSTSAPRTRCASWPPPVCWRCWRPIAVGFSLGVGALGAFLAGAIGTGTLMAVFLANSGGAWDNAKKLVEDGHHGGKGSEAHAATVIGDTVGDPFKDTAGPAINPLLKVMNLVSLLIAPAIVTFSFGDDASLGLRAGIALSALAVIVGAVYISKRRGIVVGDEDNNETAARSVDAAVMS